MGHPRSVPTDRRRWLVIVAGALTLVVGLLLVTRPFSSVTVLILLAGAGAIATGIGDLAASREAPDRRVATVVGIVWIGLGLVILVWPGLSLRLLAILVGLALIASGVARGASAWRGNSDVRTADGLLGAASIILGLVALAWPDLTIVIVGVVFGIRLILFGLARIGDGLRGGPGTASPGPASRWRRWTRTIASAAALLVAPVLAVISVRINQGAPTVDAFYRPSGDVPTQAGILLRHEPFTRAVPAGAEGWRILYTTTSGAGQRAVASGLVVVPRARDGATLPVIAWQHGTTGVDQTCAPSLLKDGFAAGAMPALPDVIARGWALVATDYIGLGTEGPHAYLVGEPAGHAALDSVRAARQLPGLRLGEQTVVWGHSQGGGAALWTGILAAGYAPDAGVVGVAALSPASDLPGFADGLDGNLAGPLFESYLIQGFSDTYADVSFSRYVKPTSRIQVREIAGRCLSDPRIAVSIADVLLLDEPIWAVDPMTGPLADRLRENVPVGPIAAPVLIGQGLDDDLILPRGQAAYVQARCDAGYAVDYRTYAGVDHVGIVADPGSPLIPELLAWTQDRFDGKPAGDPCQGASAQAPGLR